jgi:PilZ domain
MSALETPVPPTPTRDEVAHALVAESALDMLDEAGSGIEVWTIACDGDAVEGSAPRLQVHDGMTLTAELMLDGLPYAVSVRVEQAGYRSEKRASLRMRVTGVRPTAARRRERRGQLDLAGALRAVSCDRMPDGHELRVTLADLSATGLGFRAEDVRLAAGDLLAVHCRFFEGPLDASVRVTSVTQMAPGDLRIGCRLEGIDAPTAQMLGQVVDRLCGGV